MENLRPPALSKRVRVFRKSFQTTELDYANLLTDTSKISQPSISYTRLFKFRVVWYWSLSQLPLPHTGQVASPSEAHIKTNETNKPCMLTLAVLGSILESPLILTCMFLDGGRKPEYPERTHAYMQTLNRKDLPYQDLSHKPSCCDSVNHHTTMQL